MHSNFVKRLLKAAWVLELVVAVLILAVTLLELFLLGEGTLSQVLGGSFSADAFFADAMTIVVGIEFVKMLMLHTPRAVTDVLLFAIARQLVVNHSSAVDTLLGVAAVALISSSRSFSTPTGMTRPPETAALKVWRSGSRCFRFFLRPGERFPASQSY
ncbi:MAG: hypothetical protein ACLRWQ_18000 [Flavonifractor plautii]